MKTISDDAYQMILRIEDQINKMFEGRQTDQRNGGKASASSSTTNVVYIPKETGEGSSISQTTKGYNDGQRRNGEFNGCC